MRNKPFLVVIVLVVVVGLAPRQASAVQTSLATFEGRGIDLRKGWGDAKACALIDKQTTCFRSRSEMHKWLDTVRSAVMLDSCSASLELFQHNDYDGYVVYLADQGYWINLTSLGFNDVTSSYINGACSALLAENIGGDGSWYPGDTSAWAYSPSMASGWNDRISSVLIFD